MELVDRASSTTEHLACGMAEFQTSVDVDQQVGGGVQQRQITEINFHRVESLALSEEGFAQRLAQGVRIREKSEQAERN